MPSSFVVCGQVFTDFIFKMSRPVFVLLRGAWPAHDAGVASPPSSTEPGTAPSRPRCPRRAQHPPKPDWPGDVEAIRKAVSDLMQEDDVVVVMRSFNLPGGAGQAELSIEGGEGQRHSSCRRDT